MRDRFADDSFPGYIPSADRQPGQIRRKRSREAELADGFNRIRYYVENVGIIGRDIYDDDGMYIIDTEYPPLADALPEQVTPECAGEWASMLDAALPRLHELRSLLERRAAYGHR